MGDIAFFQASFTSSHVLMYCQLVFPLLTHILSLHLWTILLLCYFMLLQRVYLGYFITIDVKLVKSKYF